MADGDSANDLPLTTYKKLIVSDPANAIYRIMENLFYITLNIRTAAGIDPYARYYLGNNEEKAEAIFRQLKGSEPFAPHTILTVDFTQMRDGIPFPLAMLGCSAEEIAFNTRIITREIFKNLNLEPD